MRRVFRCLALAALGLQLAPAVPAAANLQFYKIAPCRLVDTRGPAGPYGAPSLLNGAIRHFALFGPNAPSAPSCNVPPTARAAALNAAIIAPIGGGGHLTIWEYNTPQPGTSNLNFAGGQVTSNGALVSLSTSATWQIDVFLAGAPGGQADLVLDVTGFYQ